MKISISKKLLLDSITPLQSIIAENNIIPALRCVKIDFEKNGFTVTGNNLEVCYTKKIAAKFDEPVSMCLNYSMLISILKNVGDKEINLNYKHPFVMLMHKKGQFKIPVENSADFPMAAEQTYGSKFTVSGSDLKGSLKVANRFVANDDVDLTSNICISIEDKAYVRATDKVRLYEEKLKAKGDKGNLLISGKSSIALHSLIEDDDLEVEYGKSSAKIVFNKAIITVVQANGDFPVQMFKKIIGSVKEGQPFKVDQKELVEGLKRAAIFANREKNGSLKLVFDKTNLEISFEGESLNSKVVENIAVKTKIKETFGYNPKYLLEILSVFDTEVDLKINKLGGFCIEQKKKVGMIAPVMLK